MFNDLLHKAPNYIWFLIPMIIILIALVVIFTTSSSTEEFYDRRNKIKRPPTTEFVNEFIGSEYVGRDSTEGFTDSSGDKLTVYKKIEEVYPVKKELGQKKLESIVELKPELEIVPKLYNFKNTKMRRDTKLLSAGKW